MFHCMNDENLEGVPEGRVAAEGTRERRLWWRLCVGELSWRRLFRSVLLIYLILVMIALFLSDWLIFPYRNSSYSEKLAGVKLIEGGDGQRLAVRFWKAPEEKGVIMLFHGNAEDIGHLDWIAAEMTASGMSVMAMDYRGYGLSEGKPTEEGCYADAEKVYEHVIGLGYAPESIVVWGRSVGGGTATELAVRKGLRGLVLESAFVTAFRAATRVPIVPFDKFDNLSKLDKIDEPLFVIHGTEDAVVGYWNGERLYSEFGGRKRFYPVEGAGHNDLWAYQPREMLREAVAFFGFASGGGSVPDVVRDSVRGGGGGG